MRAKTINEIKRGTEGLGSLGVGRAAVLKGATHIKNNWPDFFQSSESLKDIKDRHLAPIVDELSKWHFYCLPENILVICRDYTHVSIDLWIEEILDKEETYCQIAIPGYPNFTAEIYYSKEYHMGKVTIYSEYTSVRGGSSARAKISAFYLIEV